jgi:hypothetical protein
MTNVLEFPLRKDPKAADAALKRTIDMALTSYLELSTSIERAMDNLETTLAELTVAFSDGGRNKSAAHARQVVELEGQLAQARRMMDEVRKDIARLNMPRKV